MMRTVCCAASVHLENTAGVLDWPISHGEPAWFDTFAGRKQFGHQECDFIQFRKTFGKANVTSLVERVSRFAVLLRSTAKMP